MSHIIPAIESTRAIPRGKIASRLCFGTLTMSPLQKALPLEEGAELLVYAAQKGINFVDTADLYQTYPYIKRALSSTDLIVATKSYAYDTKSAEASFRRAVEGIGREYVDIFLLHEQESMHTLRGHNEALEWFMKKRREGLIGAVGISTHHVAGVRAAVKHGGLNVLHPLINYFGIGIADGTRQEMEHALNEADAAGLFIYAMKPLGGGHLISRRRDAFHYIMNLRAVHSIAIGMQSREEIDYNIAIFSGEVPNEQLAAGRNRSLMIHDWCEGCGKCLRQCGQGALRLENGHACVDETRCVLCGYCAAVCPQFCIKVI